MDFKEILCKDEESLYARVQRRDLMNMKINLQVP